MLAIRPILVPALLGLALATAARAGDEARGANASSPGRVEGRVFDADGWPLPRARIYALRRAEQAPDTRENRPILETSSDAEGRFALGPLEPGSYQIDIQAPGHQAAHVGVHLPGTPVTVPPLEVHLWPVTTQSPRAPRAPLPSAAAANVPAGPPSAASAPSAPEPSVAASEPESTGAPSAGSVAPEVMRALEAGQVPEARALLDRVDGVGAADADLFYAVGEALLRWGETADAVAVLEGALARDPRHVEARYRRALGLLALARRGEARAEFEQVLELRREGPLADGARSALAALDPTRPGR